MSDNVMAAPETGLERQQGGRFNLDDRAVAGTVAEGTNSQEAQKHGKKSPIRSFGFWVEGDWWSFPFFSLSASRYFGHKETLCLYWPLGTVVISGPKVLDFYNGFCAHRTTCLKADGKDIKVLNLIFSGDSDRGVGLNDVV